MASFSANGIVAAVVFPNRSMLMITFESSTPSFSVAAWMMRRFAWCDTKRSRSPGTSPLRSSSRRAISSVFRTANLKTVCAVLLHVVQPLIHGFVGRRPQAPARRHAQRRTAASVDLVLVIENGAFVLASRRHDAGAGAVAEQHARRSILVVDDARHDVGADHQRVVVSAGRHYLTRRGQRIRECRAGGADIEAPRVRSAELVLEQARRARKQHVGRHRAHDDQANIVGREPSPLDGLGRRFPGQVRSRHAGIDDVAFADAGPLQDPLVGRVDHLFEIRVGQEPRRHIRRQRLDRRRTPAAARRLSKLRLNAHHSRESLRR